MTKELNPKGLQIRKEMFGEEFVAKRLANATDFSRPFVEIINDFAYGEVWTRPGLDRKARSMLTLGMLIANVPVVLAGNFAADRMPLTLIRRIAAVCFAGLALYAVYQALSLSGMLPV